MDEITDLQPTLITGHKVLRSHQDHPVLAFPSNLRLQEDAKE